MHFHFKQMTENDLATLAKWLHRAHVAQWWGAGATLKSVRATYLSQLSPDSSVVSYFAYLGDEAIGYIQSYVAVESDGWWVGQDDPSVRGIDQFVADGARLGQGLGTRMAREFAELLFGDSAVSKIQADPSSENGRAIRCYEKAGFRNAGPIITPDGEAILMILAKNR
ncbi:MAG: GNAT family N-acetyltransferase [Candidatus Acidiferrum sp.]|jgi:aminoglycoside 6'-N-acetyltransferase-1b